MTIMKIAVCGGGNVAHSMAGHLAAQGHSVHLYTRKPAAWTRRQTVLRDGTSICVDLAGCSSDPAIVGDCELVLISVPQFAMAEVCNKLSPHLHSGQGVVMVPGVATATALVPLLAATGAAPLILQRVPFICRTEQYGGSVHILGGRSHNGLYAESEANYKRFAPLIEQLFGAEIHKVASTLVFLLSISNPILHPARLLSLFGQYRTGVVYDRQFLFYREWDDEASRIYLGADDELQAIARIGASPETAKEIVSARRYYESPDIASMTRKISSISAFAAIRTPMLPVEGGWVPDFASRYFTEDIPYGTEPIQTYARQLGVETPFIDAMVRFGKKWMLPEG